ncbi:MAG TPA: cysteine desulfurase family protein [Acidimicrobiales bacterium]
MDEQVEGDTTPRAYFDHAATTPMRPEAIEAMRPYLDGRFGNPSGSHAESRRARLALDDAREQVAGLLGADLGEVVFTSGGTEADNLAVAGGWHANAFDNHPMAALVCSAMEHHAVLNACRALARRTGAELREVRSDQNGIIDLDQMAEACTPEVGLVSVMAVNNEIGTVQPLGAVADIVRAHSPLAVLHTDAVQAAPWLDVTTLAGSCDLIAVSAHKFGGPKGVGALVVRAGTGLEPLLYGGGQERERRSGTPDVAGIVAMAAALAVTVAERDRITARVVALRDRLGDALVATVAGVAETGDRRQRTPGHLHLRFSGIESEAMVVLLDAAGVAVSAGAACSSGAVEASHVLEAMGLDRAQATTGIRFSLGSTTTEADVDLALAVVPDVVAQLRD